MRSILLVHLVPILFDLRPEAWSSSSRKVMKVVITTLFLIRETMLFAVSV